MSKRKRNWSMSEEVDTTHVQAPPLADKQGLQTALPPISRKITACNACRKQKIKCNMPNETPPCTRCARRGLDCVLNKSLQALLDDQKQTEVLQYDVSNIHKTLVTLCQAMNVELPRPLATAASAATLLVENGDAVHSDTDKDHDDACELSPPTSPSAIQAPIDTFLDAARPSPLSADTPQSFRQKKVAAQQDLISKGIIQLNVAERLVERYFSRLDHYLYGIGSQYSNMQGLRQVSPVLLAAICTVSALHEPNDQSIYEACNKEYRRLVSRALFEKRDIEYIRALCIGSFWLADASRILSSDAIRRAADAHLHRHFHHVLGGHDEPTTMQSSTSVLDSRDRTRLWYLLFVCDQHLSILHNRDSLSRHDKEILINWEAYLDSNGTTDSDIRILSQVSLLLIMSQVRDSLSSETPEKLPKGVSAQLNQFSRQLDKWFAKFSALFQPNPRIGDFPRKGLQLHYQFGKLYLGQHVFRGLSVDPIPSQFITAAGMAHDAAIAIFEMILYDEQLQHNLLGIPHYFHIMIAFAGHFLIEVCSRFADQLMIDLDSDFQLIGKVLALFNNIQCIPYHPISRMTAGLGRKLMDRTATMTSGPSITAAVYQAHEAGFIHPSEAQPILQNNIPDTTRLTTGSQLSFEIGQMPPLIDDFELADFDGFNFPT